MHEYAMTGMYALIIRMRENGFRVIEKNDGRVMGLHQLTRALNSAFIGGRRMSHRHPTRLANDVSLLPGALALADPTNDGDLNLVSQFSMFVALFLSIVLS